METVLSRFSPAAVKDDSKKIHYREKIKGYMDRAEQIKDHLNKAKEGETRLYYTCIKSKPQ